MSKGGSYDPHAVEAEIYKFWEDGGHFNADPNPDKRPFVIDIPLPNVTGALHLGHAINQTLQDLLIRRHRMQGFEALWMPGTDHAGIATQAVVERKLFEEEGKTRHDFGREAFVEKIWEWKEEYGGRILSQLRKMGFSCDWRRTRFTLDEVCARAVHEVFFEWFKAGLIYRGQRLVNWDAHLQTAVSDDEVIYEDVKGHFWHYRYPIEGRDATADDAKMGVDYLVIATTRPETMLGDTALAVHPDDERYQHLIGKNCVLPLMNRAIPIIADGLLAKRELGTGCVKVTPGHDPNDYACGLRNNLPQINILTPDGKINDNGGKYAGLNRYEARKQVVADLEALGLMERIEDHEHAVGHSDRSKTPIEPMLSEQWFLKMGELAEMAMDAVRDGRVQFFPGRYAKTMLDWLGEKRDWCISRQLWWGHRIPVWSRTSTNEAEAAQVAEELRQRLAERAGEGAWELRTSIDDAGAHRISVGLRDPNDTGLVEIIEKAGLEQDPDVLDTWFSSALWPFSTLGWPDDYGRSDDATERRSDEGTEARRHEGAAGGDVPTFPPSHVPTDLDYFYPTSVLVTARDIITLWVARMIITGLYFQKRVPFQHVYIHPNIQDGTGRRMSKSIGNGVDPVDIIDRYGADALRFTMAQMASETQDARLPVSYLCPHCGELTAQSSVVPHNKVPRDILEVQCKSCKKPFATVWATPEKKHELGVGIDTSERFEQGRNLCNKLWQATTGFVLANLDDTPPRELTADDLAIEDRWIISRLAATIDEVDRRYAHYQVNEMCNILYAFFWSDFCDWYIELVKPRLFAKDASGEVQMQQSASAATARQVLALVSDQILRLLHPVIPFITEALWRELAEKCPRRGLLRLHDAEPALIAAAWPDAAALPRDPAVEREIEALQDVIRALRDTLARVNASRSAAKTSAIGKLPRAVIKAEAQLAPRLAEQVAVLERLGRCEALTIGSDVTKPAESATQVLTGVEVYVPLEGLMDLAAERKRLQAERDNLRGHIERLTNKLGNEGFVSKAPPAVVERERERLAEMKERYAAIETNLADLA
jgi:valyl-tRNA synthetase